MKLRDIVLGTLLVSNVQLAHSAAGTGSSGGGFAVVCRSADGKINSAELLDLYEAKNKFNYSVVKSENNIKQDFLNSIDRQFNLMGIPNKFVHADSELDAEYEATYNFFFSHATFVNKVTPINDVGAYPKIPTGCKLEQMAMFLDTEYKIQLNLEVWTAFDSLSKAALIKHELMYYNYRKLNDETSEKTRADVACIFSTDCQPGFVDQANLLGAIAGNKNLDNTVNDSAYFKYRIENGVMTLFFQQISYRQILTRTVATFKLGNIHFSQTFDDAGMVKSVTSNAVSPIILSSKMFSSAEVNNPVVSLILSPNKTVEIVFYENGKIYKKIDWLEIR